MVNCSLFCCFLWFLQRFYYVKDLSLWGFFLPPPPLPTFTDQISPTKFHPRLFPREPVFGIKTLRVSVQYHTRPSPSLFTFNDSLLVRTAQSFCGFLVTSSTPHLLSRLPSSTLTSTSDSKTPKTLRRPPTRNGLNHKTENPCNKTSISD